MSDSPGILLGHQFDDIEQQREASILAMWVFLATEILLFGGLFFAYTAYRQAFPGAFAAASNKTVYWIGTLNTGVLLISSVTMALSVHAAREGRRKALLRFLLATLFLGLTFLGLKGFEYYLDYESHIVPGLNWPITNNFTRHQAIFFLLYFFMTGLHAFHLTVGCCLVSLMIFWTWRGRFSKEHYIPIDLTGLYWHLIDLVWIFLYPLFYLPGRHL
ncbi:MAG TPA: cytochrome c oxidase subunit 3 [Chthonomonadaceae bacterium]|nr:cytochrome c oxidase subunit 3 [Chthonomonadaceae bacterium]